MNNVIENMVEIELPSGPVNEIGEKQKAEFLKIKETLTRIGIASRKENKLYQSCHILHKQSRYYICHFKEMFLLDGREANFSDEDKTRRKYYCTEIRRMGLV